MKNTYQLSDFLEDLTDAFMPMRFQSEDSETRWNLLVRRKLGAYSSETLQRAADDLQSSRKARGFPQVAELIDACIQADKHVSLPRQLALEDQATTVSASQAWITGTRHVEQMIFANKPPLAIKAAREGWIGMLVSFVRRRHQMPTEAEARDLPAEQAKFEADYEACVRNDSFDHLPLGRALESWGAALRRDAETYRNRLLGASQ